MLASQPRAAAPNKRSINWRRDVVELEAASSSTVDFVFGGKTSFKLYSVLAHRAAFPKNSFGVSELLRRQIFVNRGCGFATVTHCTHDEIGAAHKVSAGEHARHTGHLVGINYHAAPIIDLDLVRIAGG